MSAAATPPAPGQAPQRVVVGISGASGAVYGVRLLQALRTCPGVESHLVVSDTGWRTLRHEMHLEPDAVRTLAHVAHDADNVGASIASGSFQCAGMVIAPCSMRTLAAVAHSLADSLLTRAADVVLKERRQLILVPREAPYSSIHLENMLKLSNLGVTILPASPGFYHQPQTLDDLVDFVVARILNCLGVPQDMLPRWGEHHLASDE